MLAVIAIYTVAVQMGFVAPPSDPDPGDGAVVAARRDATKTVSRAGDRVRDLIGRSVSDVRTDATVDECARGRWDLSTRDNTRLRCAVRRTLVSGAQPSSRWQEMAPAVHAGLTAAGFRLRFGVPAAPSTVPTGPPGETDAAIRRLAPSEYARGRGDGRTRVWLLWRTRGIVVAPPAYTPVDVIYRDGRPPELGTGPGPRQVEMVVVVAREYWSS